MKKILFLLLFAATSAGAQMSSDTSFRFDETWDRWTLTKGFLRADDSFTFDCEQYETFTEWAAKSEGNATKNVHSHEWVYAEHEDINTYEQFTTLEYCPCGCPQTENQARICETCLRHECRTREYGQRPKEKVKSKYMQILEKTPEITFGGGAGDGPILDGLFGSQSVIHISFKTGKNPLSDGVILIVPSFEKKMFISEMDGYAGETFRHDAHKFRIVKISDGFAVTSIGALPENKDYAIKLTFN